MSITEEKIKEFREKFVVKVYDEAIVGQWDNVGLEGFIMAEDLESWLKSTLEQVVKETKEDMRIELAKKVIDLKDEEESKLFYKLLKYLGIEVVAKTNKKK